MDKCIERIQLHLPEALYHDLLVEAAEQDIPASAFIRHICEQYLYGHRRRPDSKSSAKERQE